VQLKYKERKHLYDQVQEIIAANVPYVFIATPNILVGAKKKIGNFKPAILDPNTLWNVEQLYFLRALRRERHGNARPPSLANWRGRRSVWFASVAKATRPHGRC